VEAARAGEPARYAGQMQVYSSVMQFRTLTHTSVLSMQTCESPPTTLPSSSGESSDSTSRVRPSRRFLERATSFDSPPWAGAHTYTKEAPRSYMSDAACSRS